jgi:hypothetical protein
VTTSFLACQLQVYNFDATVVQNTAVQLYPTAPHLSDILGSAAQQAGILPGTPAYNSIISICMATDCSSHNKLDTSWYLRDSAVGFTLVEKNIIGNGNCIGSSTTPPSWCYGTWDSALRYAKDATAVSNSINDITRILQQYSP